MFENRLPVIEGIGVNVQENLCTFAIQSTSNVRDIG